MSTADVILGLVHFRVAISPPLVALIAQPYRRRLSRSLLLGVGRSRFGPCTAPAHLQERGG
jgi:hypothetical protein